MNYSCDFYSLNKTICHLFSQCKKTNKTIKKQLCITLLHATLFVVLTCYTLINHPALGTKSAVCQPSNLIGKIPHTAHAALILHSHIGISACCQISVQHFFSFIIPVLSKIMKTKYKKMNHPERHLQKISQILYFNTGVHFI